MGAYGISLVGTGTPSSPPQHYEPRLFDVRNGRQTFVIRIKRADGDVDPLARTRIDPGERLFNRSYGAAPAPSVSS